MKNKITTNNAALPADPRERDELLSLFQEIREGIESHVEIMRAAWEKGKPYAVKVGVLLIKAKKAAKAQGLDWIPLVEAHCCDKRTAQRYMRLAEHKDDPRLIAAEEDAKAHGRALSIELADTVLRKTTKANEDPQPIGGKGASKEPDAARTPRAGLPTKELPIFPQNPMTKVLTPTTRRIPKPRMPTR